MKMSIWDLPEGSVGWGGETLAVVVNNLREARRIASSKTASFNSGMYGGKRSVDVSKRKPDRVLQAPCGAIFHWEE